MNRNELKDLFDNQAPGYDDQWKRTAPIKDGLLFLLNGVFADLPQTSRVLCVGAGTGEEIAYLAKRFPQWTFTAVEPSSIMMDLCRQRAESEGFISRCDFHEGYLETLPREHQFDAATCFLVSHFILDQDSRSAFFREIAARLRVGGILASSDLASDIDSNEYTALLKVWFNVMSQSGVPEEGLQRMRTAYGNDVALLPPSKVETIIKAGGFDSCVEFYQAGLIHAWFSKKVEIASH